MKLDSLVQVEMVKRSVDERGRIIVGKAFTGKKAKVTVYENLKTHKKFAIVSSQDDTIGDLFDGLDTFASHMDNIFNDTVSDNDNLTYEERTYIKSIYDFANEVKDYINNFIDRFVGEIKDYIDGFIGECESKAYIYKPIDDLADDVKDYIDRSIYGFIDCLFDEVKYYINGSVDECEEKALVNKSIDSLVDEVKDYINRSIDDLDDDVKEYINSFIEEDRLKASINGSIDLLSNEVKTYVDIFIYKANILKKEKKAECQTK